MTDAQRRGVRRWVIALAATAVIMFGVVGGAVLLVDYLQGGPDTRSDVATLATLAEGQEESAAVQGCRSSFATADAVASARLDIAKANGIDVFLARSAGVPLDRQTFTDAHLALTSANQVREAEALLRGLSNVVCVKVSAP